MHLRWVEAQTCCYSYCLLFIRWTPGVESNRHYARWNHNFTRCKGRSNWAETMVVCDDKKWHLEGEQTTTRHVEINAVYCHDVSSNCWQLQWKWTFFFFSFTAACTLYTQGSEWQGVHVNVTLTKASCQSSVAVNMQTRTFSQDGSNKAFRFCQVKWRWITRLFIQRNSCYLSILQNPTKHKTIFFTITKENISNAFDIPV